MKMEEIDALTERMRGFGTDHKPHGWPAVQMSDITSLCNAIAQLRGEAGVLRALLLQALGVIEADIRCDCDDVESLTVLAGLIKAAVEVTA